MGGQDHAEPIEYRLPQFSPESLQSSTTLPILTGTRFTCGEGKQASGKSTGLEIDPHFSIQISSLERVMSLLEGTKMRKLAERRSFLRSVVSTRFPKKGPTSCSRSVPRDVVYVAPHAS